MEVNEYSFTVLIDEKSHITLDYGITRIPTTIFIDQYGVIRVIKIGKYHSVAEIEDDLASIQ